MAARSDDRRRTRDILDVQDGTGPVALLDAATATAALRAARRIAVIVASPDPWRPSHGVMGTLLDSGYECVPVNPNVPEVHGIRSWPTLEAAVAATGPVDLVDVFRRSEYVPDIARSAVTVGAKVLWLQLGVVSWEAAEIAHGAGLGVVMDRCTAIELRGWRVGDP
jgi:predicted CoA-binding protein